MEGTQQGQDPIKDALIDPEIQKQHETERLLAAVARDAVAERAGTPPAVARLRHHPACAAIPMMGAEDLAALEMSIRRHGLLEQIVVIRVPGEGGREEVQILDGRSREQACFNIGYQLQPHDFVDFGVVCQTEEGKVLTPEQFTHLQNVVRRHLAPAVKKGLHTPEDWQAIIQRAVELRELGRKRQAAGGGGKRQKVGSVPGETHLDTAQQLHEMGASKTEAATAVMVASDAEVREKVIKGELTPQQGAEEARKKRAPRRKAEAPTAAPAEAPTPTMAFTIKLRGWVAQLASFRLNLTGVLPTEVAELSRELLNVRAEAEQLLEITAELGAAEPTASASVSAAEEINLD